MKIYTRTGDQGETGLFGGARVMKNEDVVDAYGTIDELNAALGVARAHDMPEEIDRELEIIQAELFVLGAELACVPDKVEKLGMQLVSAKSIDSLEKLIDRTEEQLPALTNFVLPAGALAGASLHHARTIARRAERRVLDLPSVRKDVIAYLNRLSDCLFVLARYANRLKGAPETPWAPRSSGG